MKYVAAILIAFGISFFFGMVLAVVQIDEEEYRDDDKEQEEYLCEWAKKHWEKR